MNLHTSTTALVATGLVALLACSLASCSHDESVDTHGASGRAHICFDLSREAASVPGKGLTARLDEEHTAGRLVLRAADSADSLCVRAVVSPRVTAKGTTTSPMQRAASVTAAAFHSSFHVVSTLTTGTTPAAAFYMDADVRKDGPVWATDRTYLWPGAEHSLRFYAWAPADAPFTATPASPGSLELSYTVPAEANAQKDLVVATTGALSGNTNNTVPLTFAHVCTAVRVATGEQMAAGTVKSVSLLGVKASGTYNMATSAWTLTNDTTNFAQTLNVALTGTETKGTAITSDEGTFMMLPQTLGEEARLQVVLQDNASGTTRTLTASLAGTEWGMGTTVTYLLSITPEGELQFLTTPTVQDAHYVVYPVTINTTLAAGGKWKLTSSHPDDVTFVEKFPAPGIKKLVDDGYWLKDYKGESTLTSSTAGVDTIYVFLKENVGTTDRDITLTLTADQAGVTPATFRFKQYCPAWNNGLGVERIQEKDYPWGFNWDSNMKVTYKMPSGLGSGFMHLFLLLFGDTPYISHSGLAILGGWTVTIDFSKVPKLTTATSSTNGLSNTWDLYTFNGVNDASSVMAQIEAWGGVTTDVLPSNPSEFAAWACARKNPYGVTVMEDGGDNVYMPKLDQADMVWYLPAQDEAPNMKDNLAGDYWTSTAISDETGDKAYKYTAGGATSAELRNNSIHVRAVRKQQ